MAGKAVGDKKDIGSAITVEIAGGDCVFAPIDR